MAASGRHGGAPVAHHFDNLRQQQATVRFGMWLFLVSEVLFFGGAFCGYTAYRVWFPAEFAAGSAALNVGIASVNTLLLITSSFTCTLAMRACYDGNPAGLRRWLLATIVLGSVFLGLKAREYQLDYAEGLVPTARKVEHRDPEGRLVTESAFVERPLRDAAGEVVRDDHGAAVTVGLRPTLKKAGFEFVESGSGVTPAQAELAYQARQEGKRVVDLHKVQLFFMFYYSMTGFHVLHMVIGIGLLVWQYVLAARGFFDHPERYVYVEVMSLYWHFVDMVWVFLLPLLYLAGPHTAAQAVDQFLMAVGLGHH